jgi:hypothetical protein
MSGGFPVSSPPPLSQKKFPTKRHFFTQMPTLEDGRIAVKRFQANETGILVMKLRT